ncbi:MAG: hypothetical protein MHM6MM_000919 [Cercozoa sp. M6MM]
MRDFKIDIRDMLQQQINQQQQQVDKQLESFKQQLNQQQQVDKQLENFKAAADERAADSGLDINRLLRHLQSAQSYAQVPAHVRGEAPHCGLCRVLAQIPEQIMYLQATFAMPLLTPKMSPATSPQDSGGLLSST